MQTRKKYSMKKKSKKYLQNGGANVPKKTPPPRPATPPAAIKPPPLQSTHENARLRPLNFITITPSQKQKANNISKLNAEKQKLITIKEKNVNRILSKFSGYKKKGNPTIINKYVGQPIVAPLAQKYYKYKSRQLQKRINKLQTTINTKKADLPDTEVPDTEV